MYIKLTEDSVEKILIISLIKKHNCVHEFDIFKTVHSFYYKKFS